MLSQHECTLVIEVNSTPFERLRGIFRVSAYYFWHAPTTPPIIISMVIVLRFIEAPESDDPSEAASDDALTWIDDTECEATMRGLGGALKNTNRRYLRGHGTAGTCTMIH